MAWSGSGLSSVDRSWGLPGGLFNPFAVDSQPLQVAQHFTERLRGKGAAALAAAAAVSGEGSGIGGGVVVQRHATAAAAGVSGAANTIPAWQSLLSIALWPLAALALAIAAFKKVTP